MKSIFKTVITGIDDEEGEFGCVQEPEMENGAITDDLARKTQVMDFIIVMMIFIGNMLFFFEVVNSNA